MEEKNISVKRMAIRFDCKIFLNLMLLLNLDI